MTDRNDRWSKYIQSTEELYESRLSRFHAANKELWLNAIGAVPGDHCLEVGCAGGAFCRRLAEFVPDISITGVDLDEEHIAFAKKKAAELGTDCRFVCADACELPFSDDTFDVCYSHTVAEHIPHDGFFREQRRVLKPGGRIAVLSVRSKLCVRPQLKRSEEETQLLQKMQTHMGDNPYEENVGIYELEEHDYPRELEKYGFRDVSTHIFTVMDYAPDNADVSPEAAVMQINAKRTGALGPVKRAYALNQNALSDHEWERLFALINARFDERIRQYRSGARLWDFSSTAVLCVSGVK